MEAATTLDEPGTHNKHTTNHPRVTTAVALPAHGQGVGEGGDVPPGCGGVARLSQAIGRFRARQRTLNLR